MDKVFVNQDTVKSLDSWDRLSLQDAKCLLVYGNKRLWSYTNVKSDTTAYCVTVGLDYINICDYICIYSHNNKIGFDYPHLYTKSFYSFLRRKLIQLGELK